MFEEGKHYAIADTGCWLWLGAVSGKPHYGSVSIDGRKYYAHRLQYEQCHGELIKGLHVTHSCDTPLCINPEHLSQESASKNAKDREKRGRGRHSKQLN